MSGAPGFIESLPTARRDEAPGATPWKVLIADDEHGVHMVTELILGRCLVQGRPLRFLHAYSGQEAVELLASQDDIALVLLDLVMESDEAGLDTLRRLRGALRNERTRVVIRTGYASRALEKEAERYGISAIRDKTELTAEKTLALLRDGLERYAEAAADHNATG